jgi:hypothetical protein
MTKIEEVIRLIKDDGDIIAEATKDDLFWELRITFDSKEAVLEYLEYLDQEYSLATQSDFPTTLETLEDCHKASIGSRWIGASGLEYERKQDGWYYREENWGSWMRMTGAPLSGDLSLTYLKPEV